MTLRDLAERVEADKRVLRDRISLLQYNISACQDGAAIPAMQRRLDEAVYDLRALIEKEET